VLRHRYQAVRWPGADLPAARRGTTVSRCAEAGRVPRYSGIRTSLPGVHARARRAAVAPVVLIRRGAVVRDRPRCPTTPRVEAAKSGGPVMMLVSQRMLFHDVGHVVPPTPVGNGPGPVVGRPVERFCLMVRFQTHFCKQFALHGMQTRSRSLGHIGHAVHRPRKRRRSPGRQFISKAAGSRSRRRGEGSRCRRSSHSPSADILPWRLDPNAETVTPDRNLVVARPALRHQTAAPSCLRPRNRHKIWRGRRPIRSQASATRGWIEPATRLKTAELALAHRHHRHGAPPGTLKPGAASPQLCTRVSSLYCAYTQLPQKEYYVK
jgi:hypothetical protein